jgi:hypothetical protein
MDPFVNTWLNVCSRKKNTWLNVCVRARVCCVILNLGTCTLGTKFGNDHYVQVDVSLSTCLLIKSLVIFECFSLFNN